MKDFLDWNRLKQELEGKCNQVYFHERQVWYCHFGLNIGRELDGKNENFVRPVIIFRKFSQKTFLALPLSSKKKQINYYIEVNYKDKINYAILDQIRVLDTKRLIKSIGDISLSQWNNLKRLIKFKVPKLGNPNLGTGEHGY